GLRSTSVGSRARVRSEGASPRSPRLCVTRSLLRITQRRRGFGSHGDAENAEEVALSGCVLRDAERSSPGSMFVLNVVSSGGIEAPPAGEPAGRGRLHPANPAPPGANHHITGSLNAPRSLRSAREPEPPSAPSEPPRSPRLCVSPFLRALLVSERSAGGREGTPSAPS